MSFPKYTEQNCSMTLKEGLEEYYNSNSKQVKEFAEKIPFFVYHDITHVIFGLGTSIEEESLLDTWTLRGTDITWKQIYRYTFDKNLRNLTKVIVKDQGGWLKVIRVVIKCIPKKRKIRFNRIPQMKKKWPYSNVSENVMLERINDIRNEYGIKVINYK